MNSEKRCMICGSQGRKHSERMASPGKAPERTDYGPEWTGPQEDRIQQGAHRCKAEGRTQKAMPCENVSDQDYLPSKVKPCKDEVDMHSHTLGLWKPWDFHLIFGCQEISGRSDIRVPSCPIGQRLLHTWVHTVRPRLAMGPLPSIKANPSPHCGLSSPDVNFPGVYNQHFLTESVAGWGFLSSVFCRPFQEIDLRGLSAILLLCDVLRRSPLRSFCFPSFPFFHLNWEQK